jgi:hypothetical protein
LTKILAAKLKGRDNLEDQGVDVKIILKRILEEMYRIYPRRALVNIL